MTIKEQLKCSSVESAALMTAKILSFCAFFAGLIAIASPEWAIVVEPSSGTDTINAYANKLEAKNQTLEITYGLYLFCYYGVDEDEDWHDKECFSSTEPDKKAPAEVRDYFDSISQDWFLLCQIFMVVSTVVALVCGGLAILSLFCQVRGKMFICGLCGLLSLGAMALNLTSVILYRIKANDKWGAMNQRTEVVDDDEYEITVRVSHFSWGWHFAAVSGFLTLIAFVSFNYAAIKLRKQVAKSI